MPPNPDLATVGPADFEPLVGDTFEVVAGDERVPLMLTSVTRSGREGTHREMFSLLFSGPHDPQLLQDTWPIEHATFGAMEVFLVPVLSTTGEPTYEVVFG